MPLMPVLLSEGASASSILQTALGTIKTDMTGAVSAAAPIALGIAGLVMVVTFGWRLFKKLSH